jgi:hypothetical protein
LALRQDDRPAARDLIERGLTIAAQRQSPEQSAELFWMRAALAVRESDSAVARFAIHHAAELHRVIGRASRIGAQLSVAALLYLDRGDIDQAHQLHRTAQHIHSEVCAYVPGELLDYREHMSRLDIALADAPIRSSLSLSIQQAIELARAV